MVQATDFGHTRHVWLLSWSPRKSRETAQTRAAGQIPKVPSRKGHKRFATSTLQCDEPDLGLLAYTYATLPRPNEASLARFAAQYTPLRISLGFNYKKIGTAIHQTLTSRLTQRRS